jgi:DNA-binding CsgD family transcriptional regulator
MSTDGLSRAECEVLCLIAEGLTDVQIARRLSRSPATIHRHANRLCAKTRCHNRVQLTRYAVASGYVPPQWERLFEKWAVQPIDAAAIAAV